MSKKLKNIHYEDRAFLLLKDKKKAASLSKNLKQILQVLDQYDTSMNCLNWFIDAYLNYFSEELKPTQTRLSEFQPLTIHECKKAMKKEY